MVLKVVKIVVVFVVLLWVVSLFFAPSVKGPGYKGGGLLFYPPPCWSYIFSVYFSDSSLASAMARSRSNSWGVSASI